MEFWTHKPNETHSNGSIAGTFGLTGSPPKPTRKFGAKWASKGLAEPLGSVEPLAAPFGLKLHRPVAIHLPMTVMAIFTGRNRHKLGHLATQERRCSLDA